MLAALVAGGVAPAQQAPANFPGATWESVTDAEAGLSTSALDSFISQVGGTVFIARNGRQVRATSGFDSAHPSDWSSGSKPMLAAWLFSLIADGTIASVDALIADYGWELTLDDQGITWRHILNQTSGYAIVALPGGSWNYNDYAVELGFETLKLASGTDMASALGSLLAPLQLQDGAIANASGRITMSPRDYARVGWWFANRFQWDGTAVLPASLHDENIGTQQVSTSLGPAATTPVDQYLGLGTYGSSVVESVDAGWTYRSFVWHNGTAKNGVRKWPGAPEDCYLFDGHGGEDFVVILPSHGIVAACIASPALGFDVGEAEGNMTTAIKTLAGAVL